MTAYCMVVRYATFQQAAGKSLGILTAVQFENEK
jgi:hypothetical protein